MKVTPQLTDIQIRRAVEQPRAKPLKLFDGGGMFLLIKAPGVAWWRLKYRFNGKENAASLGVYPEVSLKQARLNRDVIRGQLAQNIDPSVQRRIVKLSHTAETGLTLGRLVEEYLEDFQKHNATITTNKTRWIFNERLAELRSLPIKTLSAQIIAPALLTIQKQGHRETAHRARTKLCQVLRYAARTHGFKAQPIIEELKGCLLPVITKSHPAITDPVQAGALMRAIEGYIGHPATVAALRLMPYVFTRTGELRCAEWKEFDLERGMWKIPAERMKMRKHSPLPHMVPLSRQAIAILRELEPITGGEGRRFVFPSVSDPDRPMSNNTINSALHRMGFTGVMVGHGFRTMAVTLMQERSGGRSEKAVNLQLAHREQSNSKRPYFRDELLEERRPLMQDWADYLDTLRDGGKVIPLRAA